MKLYSYTTIIMVLTLAVAVCGGPSGCSCTGDESGTELEPRGLPEPLEAEEVQLAVEEEAEEDPLPLSEDDEPEPEPAQEVEQEPPPEPEPEPEPDPRILFPLEAVAFQFATNVVAEPAPQARVIGYLRRGARVRVTERVGRRGCRRGWHRVQGGGFVCHGGGVVVGENPEDWPDSPVAPNLDSPLPYSYYSIIRDDIPEYHERPSAANERDVAAAVRRLRAPQVPEQETPLAEQVGDEAPGAESAEAAGDAAESEPDAPAEPVNVEAPEAAPASAAGEASDAVVTQGGSERVLPAYVRLLLARGFIISSDQVEGRWMRTVRGRFVERTMLTEREAPTFSGVELGDEMSLPVAFVVKGRSKALRPRPGAGLRFEVAGTLRRMTPVPVLGEVMRGEQRYISIGKRLLARDDVLTIAEPIERPPDVGPDEKWIDVRLSTQTLVAYEGDTPVYATLVSTGRSAEGFATPTGTFRIRTKHVSATMDDPDGGAEAYSIEDVPWTMYFHESYALHAAFWHSFYGQERSHGCVNLSPTDARWLFFWAGPTLPPGWHGVRATAEHPGTVVVIRD